MAGDAQVVHRDLALLDQRTGAPAAPVDDLLVGEHGQIDRIPVHDAGLLVGDALLEHAQEQPLVPLVVVGVAGGQLTRPVDGQAQRLQLALHVGDVVARPLGRRHAVGHGGVLGRQAESVPAHGLQHVAALHAHEAREHVADGVVAHMAHVQPARGVGKHGQAVEFLAGRVFVGDKGALRVPVSLRAAFDSGRVVTFLHHASLHDPAEPRTSRPCAPARRSGPRPAGSAAARPCPTS